MNSASHTIRQQHLHVELNGSESDGMALQRRLPALCRDWLLPALERTLDRHAPAEGTLCIERLEIDAGTMSLDRLEHDLAELVAQALEKALREQISADEPADAGYRPGNIQHKTKQHSVNEALAFFLKTGQLPWSFRLPEGRSLEQVVLDAWQETEQSGGSQGAEQMRQVLTSASARKRLTRQFTPTLLRMLISRLAPAGAAVMDNMLQALDSGKAAPAERRQVERLLRESAFAVVVAGQFVTTETIIRNLLPVVPAEHSAAVEVLARHWLSEEEILYRLPAAGAAQPLNRKQSNIKAESCSQAETEQSAVPQKRPGKAELPSTSAEKVGNRPAWEEEADMKEKANGKPPPDAENVQIVQRRKRITQERSIEILQGSASLAASPPPDAENVQFIQNSGSAPPSDAYHPTAQHGEPAKDERTGKVLSDTDNAQVLQRREETIQKEQSAEAASPSPVCSPTQFAAQHTSPDLLAEGIYINNAGLVLLHPFLPQFFGALGIAADKQLLQPERAICLLHFLATGQPVAPEYELMLPKVLCNIPLDEPVESNVALTAAEQDEAVALLKAVIRHWDALRNTSPDGLRGTFFVRLGKISLRDSDWLLQVEPQTWDILLDQLPWGIGMIKLPWMDRLLHVEWN